MSSSCAVVGCGPGGLALACELSSRGYAVNLLNPTEERIADISKRGAISCEGDLSGVFSVSCATTNPRIALRGVKYVFVVAPGNAHSQLARLCGPHLGGDQVVVLSPGRMFGAVEFSNKLSHSLTRGFPAVGETDTLIHTCRKSSHADVLVLGRKPKVSLAFDTPKSIKYVTECQEILPFFEPAANLLETSLNSVGCILHPVPTILNIGRIESGGEGFKFYGEGITETVAEFVSAVDRERVSIGKQLGVKMVSITEWFERCYRVQGSEIIECLPLIEPYSTIEAPRTIRHRYLLEDVPTGLVPLRSLAMLVGRAVPVTELFIQLAGVALRQDLTRCGRTMESLGFGDFDIDTFRSRFFCGSEN